VETLTREEAYAFLESALVAHIGVIAGDEPYVTPMSFVVDDDRILFRTKPGRRLQAIKESSRVSIEVSTFDETMGDWVSVVVAGNAKPTDDPTTKDRAVQLLLAKYQESLGSPLSTGGLQPMSGFPHVVEVSIDDITGMCSGRGFAARTRPGRL
jgi:nitroimidazol reductase NimA-like FMN-containing flavoprotein (pyridoxamine 5'-phosphate oxidase superfamily)